MTIMKFKANTPGKAITASAADQGLSKTALARLTGMSYPNVVRIMADDVTLTPEAALLLAAALGLSAEDLLALSVKYEIAKLKEKMTPRLTDIERKRHLFLAYPMDSIINTGLISKHDSAVDIEDLLASDTGDDDEYWDHRKPPEVREKSNLVRVWRSILSRTLRGYSLPAFLWDINIISLAQKVVELVSESTDWINMTVRLMAENGILLLPVPPFTLKGAPSLAFINDSPVMVFPNPKGREDVFLYWLLDTLEGLTMSPQYRKKNQEAKHKNMVQITNEVLPIAKIKAKYKSIGGDIGKIIETLRPIPELIITGYFRWFKAHYRERRLGNARRVSDIYDTHSLDQYR